VVRKSQRDLEDKTVGGKLLGKTMKFVSEVLFARDGSPESKGKGKAADQDSVIGREFKKWGEERFKEFGKELPKAWQIEGAGLDVDTRSTTPLSHIPTFGFYSAQSPKKSDVPLTNKGSQAGVGASGVDEDQDAGSHSDGMKDVLRGCKRVVVIGIHGWFPGICLLNFLPDGSQKLFRSYVTDFCPTNRDEHQVCQHDRTGFTTVRGRTWC
jgi:hypothetical protein